MRTQGLLALTMLFAPVSVFSETTQKSGAETPATLKSEAQALATPDKNLLLDMDGAIFQSDHFPESCKPILVGGPPCAEPPYGTFHAEDKKDGDLIDSKGVFTGPDKMLFTEECWYANAHLDHAIVFDSVLNASYTVDVKNKKVYYKKTDLTTGKVSSSDDDYLENMILPSTLVPYLRAHADDLVAGKDVRVKFIAVDRLDSYEFLAKKKRMEKTPDGKPVLVLEFGPTSFFVKAVVSPMYIYVNPDTFQMLGFEGRSALRVKDKDGKSFKELRSNVGYTYKLDSEAVVMKRANPPDQTCTDEMNKTGETKCAVPSVESTSAASSSQSP